MQCPLFIHLLLEIPMPAALLAGGHKDRVRIPPFVLLQGALPHGLRFRTHKNIFSESFELESIAAIQQGIVLPTG